MVRINAFLFKDFEHAQLRKTPRSAAAEHIAQPLPGQRGDIE
ncbi:MAG: hypothetical protein BWX83_00668 [Candidatus Cloacimonetes bacterium ADurb.Bin117]|nr:MAG: hypothetical protein BWX83_00668 [Candidatus Cloacimonetes bacterium ADurb.Bin117]